MITQDNGRVLATNQRKDTVDIGYVVSSEAC